MRVRLEPVNVCIDVEAADTIACIAKARAALEGAGFKPTCEDEEWPYWILRDSRAIDGTDSGSPTAVAYDPERAET